MTSPFDEDYYLRGPATGKSNYVNYRWQPELTVPTCKKIAEYLGMRVGDSLLDYGASRGFMVRAFRELGYKAFGYDISEWAIDNCDETVKEVMFNHYPNRSFEWLIAKDVMEHIDEQMLVKVMNYLHEAVSKGMFFIVPLALGTGGEYVRLEDRMDSTHVIRWTLEDWILFFERYAPDFNVNASYHIHGIKPASGIVHHSCGFFTLVRP